MEVNERKKGNGKINVECIHSPRDFFLLYLFQACSQSLVENSAPSPMKSSMQEKAKPYKCHLV